jgi:glyceraldehyde-3-phosphate dehydrogenase (NADP+)
VLCFIFVTLTGKPAYLAELRADAVAHGAKCLVPGAAQDLGHTFAPPAILYPVSKDMRVWHEEQFGPVVPVGSFSDISEVRYHITWFLTASSTFLCCTF